MSVPQYPDKWRHRSLVEPHDYIQYRQERGKNPEWPVPRTMLMVFQQTLVQQLASREMQYSSAGILYFGDPDEAKVGMTLSGIGAPAAAVLMEELIAQGARRIIAVGTAGSLTKGIEPGDVVVCQQAVRDEGVSHHYLRPGMWALPDYELSKQVSYALGLGNVEIRAQVSSWTTDAPYRETDKEANFYIQHGVWTVEMEAAALMAVAEFREVPFATVFTISDQVDATILPTGWRPRFHTVPVAEGLLRSTLALLTFYSKE